MYQFIQSNKTVLNSGHFSKIKIQSKTSYITVRSYNRRVQYIKTEFAEIQNDSLIIEYFIPSFSINSLSFYVFQKPIPASVLRLSVIGDIL